MTERTERVDLDRLADYIGGALDDTPDAAAVRQLIDTDPGWAAAHADLTAAMAAVTADLRTVGSRPDPVPEDVAARLDAVLRPLDSSEFEPRTVTAPRTARANGADAGRSARPDAGRPDAGRPGARPGGAGPGRRTSRRAKWAAGLSAAAAVIAVGVGLVSLAPSMNSSDSQTAGAPAADSAGGAAPQSAVGGPPPVASGRDYRPGAFGGLGSDQRAQAQEGAPGATDSDRQFSTSGEAPPSAPSPAEVPPPLARLTGAEARQACLDAIRSVHGGVPRTVEFARFVGQPALIVLLDGAAEGNGAPWVVVAGPDCGRTPGDTDELYNGPLA